MPAFETMDLHQRALWWPAAGRAPVDAEPLRGEPLELPVRWVTGRTEGVDPQGHPIVLDATVVTARKVAVGDLFWLGRTAEFNPSDGGNEIMRVASYEETPSIHARFTRTTCGLQRFRGRLPSPAGA